MVRSSTLSSTASAREFETKVKDLTMPIEFSLDNMNYFIDWTQAVAVRGRARRGRVRGLTGAMTMSATIPDLETVSAEEVLAYAVQRFHPRLKMACSFQKEESVLLHMLTSIEPDARVFMIDTGVLFGRRSQTWKRFEERFGASIEVVDARSPMGSGR